MSTRYGTLHIDRQTGALFQLSILLPLLAGREPWAVWVCFGLPVAGGLFTLWSLATDASRYVRREVLPRLASELAPLSPAPEEIETALGRLREAGLAVGRIPARAVLDALALQAGGPSL